MLGHASVHDVVKPSIGRQRNRDVLVSIRLLTVVLECAYNASTAMVVVFEISRLRASAQIKGRQTNRANAVGLAHTHEGQTKSTV